MCIERVLSYGFLCVCFCLFFCVCVSYLLFKHSADLMSHIRLYSLYRLGVFPSAHVQSIVCTCMHLCVTGGAFGLFTLHFCSFDAGLVYTIFPVCS